VLCLQQCIGLLTSLIHCKRGVFATAGTKDKRAVTVQSVTAFKVFACSLTDLSSACVCHSCRLNRSADSMQCASAVLVFDVKDSSLEHAETHLWLQRHTYGCKLFTCWGLQPLQLDVFWTASQYPRNCISTSLGLHLDVFGTASQCLWDCISMALGLHLNVFGTAGVC